jgi:hypothetical protein
MAGWHENGIIRAGRSVLHGGLAKDSLRFRKFLTKLLAYFNSFFDYLEYNLFRISA